MKSTYVIYYEAYSYDFKLVSNGNHEVTVHNAGEGFLSSVHSHLLDVVKKGNSNVVALAIKHICKL